MHSIIRKRCAGRIICTRVVELQPSGGINLLDDEWVNIRAGQEWAAEHAKDLEAADSCSYYPAAGAHLLRLLVHPRERVRWLQAALSAARQLNDRRGEGRHLNNLGLTYAAISTEFDEQYGKRLLEEFGKKTLLQITPRMI
jgi:hypothetical protein